MDLVKIGELLRELRKEQNLTQEQLAEKMGVARRTVSRWETGSNMPDLDILMELSDLYEVDLREILSGERKSERMNEEVKETVLQVADYSIEEKARLLRRIHWLFVAGLLGFATFLVILALGLEAAAPYESIGSYGLGVAFGTICVGVIFTSRYTTKIREFKLRLLGKKSRGQRMNIVMIFGLLLGGGTIAFEPLMHELPQWLARYSLKIFRERLFRFLPQRSIPC